jgi:DNA-binding transcriptional regulator PaaX
MKHILTEQVREAGYEALFLVGGFLGLSVEPAFRNLEEIFRWQDDVQSWRMHLKRLQEKGLIEGDLGKGRWVGRITAMGVAVFSGGRQPEEAWSRGWDGQWRLLSFDLPRRESATRMKLRRWLMARRFGRLQGSVWICPDPVSDLGGMLAGDRVGSDAVMVFEGNLAGKVAPREVAVMGWDFDVINAGYRRYVDGANRALQQVQKKAPSMERLRDILRVDRRHWLEVVGRDPLLPEVALPGGYEGGAAWEARGRLMGKLGALVEERV